jgi:hypothetical protein
MNPVLRSVVQEHSHLKCISLTSCWVGYSYRLPLPYVARPEMPSRLENACQRYEPPCMAAAAGLHHLSFFDNTLLMIVGSIRRTALYVKEILATKCGGVVLIAEKGIYRGVRLFEKSAHLLVFSPVIKDVSAVIRTDFSCTSLFYEALRVYGMHPRSRGKV